MTECSRTLDVSTLHRCRPSTSSTTAHTDSPPIVFQDLSTFVSLVCWDARCVLRHIYTSGSLSVTKMSYRNHVSDINHDGSTRPNLGCKNRSWERKIRGALAPQPYRRAMITLLSAAQSVGQPAKVRQVGPLYSATHRLELR